MKAFDKLLLLLLLFPSLSFCQKDTVLIDSRNDSVIFKYSETPAIKDTTTNIFIETLSKSIPKILTFTQYSFSYNIDIFITNGGKPTKAGRTLNISFALKNGKCTGDNVYKSFSIADVLLPNVFNMTLSIKNTAGKSMKPFVFSALNIKNGESKMNTFTFHDSLSDAKYKVSVAQKQFYYNDSAYLAFKKKITYIDDYYKSEFVIAAALEKLEKMNLANVELVKIYEIEVREVEKIVNDLKNKDFPATLGLAAFDPIDFTDKYKNLVQQTAKQRFIVNNMVSSIDNVYYKKGIEFLENNDTAEALKYFEKSIESNSYYSPSYYQMASIYLAQDSIDKAIAKLITLLSKLNPDQATLKKGLLLGNKIYSLCLSKGEEFETAESYLAALMWLCKAKKFCTAVPLIACSEELQTDIAKGHFGIYSSYCTVSQKAIHKEIYDIAEIYTLKAKAYQKEHSSEIIFSTEADELLADLVMGLSSKGFLLNKEKRYDSAMVMLEKASSLCKEYPDIKCSEKLHDAIIVSRKGAYRIFIHKAAKYIEYGELEKADSAITAITVYQQLHSAEIADAKAVDTLIVLLKKKWYNKYIAEGTNDLVNKEGIKALHNFELAKILEKSYALEKDSILDSLILASAEPYILNIIETGCVKAWGNELAKARAIGDSARSLQNKYSLNSDTIIINALTDLDTKIFNTHCRNARESYNEYYRNAYQNIPLRKYAKVDEYFIRCLKIAGDNKECGINDSLAKAGREKYIFAVTYQRKLLQSDSLAAIARYSDAIRKYMEGSAYFAAHDMQDFGLTHTPLKEYLSSLKDNDYLLGCANYYFEMADYPNAFYFLEILRKKYYATTNTASMQQALAATLAPADYANNPKQKPNALINSYTGGNAWYNTFKKAYLIKWKELKKGNFRFKLKR